MPALSNPKHELFAQQLAQGATADDAYVLAGYKPNRGNAARLKANDSLRARVAEIQAAGAERAEVSVEGVLRELWSIGTADANELVEHRVGCCRYCWGKGNRYQETPAERERRYRDWEQAEKKRLQDDDEAEYRPFDEQGGVGFNATIPPNAECPECFGDGESRPVFKDTRRVSSAARSLFGGVKVTKDGLQFVMHDKVGALSKVGQHLGMFVERQLTATVSLEDLLEELDAEDAAESEASEG